MNATPWPADWPNTPVPKPPEPLKDPDVRWCEPCKMDHRKHESCPFEISRRLHPTPGVRCKYCDEPVIRLVPGQDQCNLCIMGGPPPRYWLNRTDRC